MSTPALLFACYFGVGLFLLVLAVATRGKEKRAEHLDFTPPTSVDAGLMIFIVMLWPIWLLASFLKDDERKR